MKCGKLCRGEVVARLMGEELSVLILTVAQVCIPSMVRMYQDKSTVPQIGYVSYKLISFNLSVGKYIQYRHSDNKQKRRRRREVTSTKK